MGNLRIRGAFGGATGHGRGPCAPVWRTVPALVNTAVAIRVAIYYCRAIWHQQTNIITCVVEEAAGVHCVIATRRNGGAAGNELGRPTATGDVVNPGARNVDCLAGGIIQFHPF